MMKKLTKHGNSLVLIIDKHILKLLGIDEKTRLEMTVKDGSLIIVPVEKKQVKHKDRDIKKIAEEIIGKYADVFQELAK